MKMYVPASIDISSVTCVNVSDPDNILFSTNDNHYYSLKYNNILSDYTLESLSNLDVSCVSSTL